MLIPALGETSPFVQSLVPVSAGRLAAVTMMDDQLLIQPLVPEVDVLGGKLVLEARREVTLLCGKTSFHLTADGRVTVRGAQALSRSDGPNRMQGAAVQLK